MDSSLVDALALLRKWSNDRSAVKLVSLEPGHWASYDPGAITDVSDKTFTFRSTGAKVEIDIGFHSTIRLEQLTAAAEPSGAIATFVQSGDDCALICEGKNGGTVVVIKRH